MIHTLFITISVVFWNKMHICYVFLKVYNVAQNVSTVDEYLETNVDTDVFYLDKKAYVNYSF